MYDLSRDVGLESSVIESVELREEFENTPWVYTFEGYVAPMLEKETALDLLYRFFEKKLETVPDEEFQEWEDRRTEFLYYVFCLGKKYLLDKE